MKFNNQTKSAIVALFLSSSMLVGEQTNATSLRESLEVWQKATSGVDNQQYESEVVKSFINNESDRKHTKKHISVIQKDEVKPEDAKKVEVKPEDAKKVEPKKEEVKPVEVKKEDKKEEVKKVDAK